MWWLKREFGRKELRVTLNVPIAHGQVQACPNIGNLSIPKNHYHFCAIYVITGMLIWVVEFSRGGTKLERLLPKNQHTQRKLLNFENLCHGEVSKIGHRFRK